MSALLRHHHLTGQTAESMYDEDLGDGESDWSVVSESAGTHSSGDCSTATEFDTEDLYAVLDRLSVSTCAERTSSCSSSDECESFDEESSEQQQYVNVTGVLEGDYSEQEDDSDPPAVPSEEDEDEGTTPLDDISDQFEEDVNVRHRAMSGADESDGVVASSRDAYEELSTDSDLDERTYVYYDPAIGRRYVADKNGNFLYRLRSDGGWADSTDATPSLSDDDNAESARPFSKSTWTDLARHWRGEDGIWWFSSAEDEEGLDGDEEEEGKEWSDGFPQPTAIVGRCVEGTADVDGGRACQRSAAAEGLHFSREAPNADEDAPSGRLSSDEKAAAVDALMSSYQLSELIDDFAGGKLVFYKSRLHEVISEYHADELRKPPKNAAFAGRRPDHLPSRREQDASSSPLKQSPQRRGGGDGGCADSVSVRFTETTDARAALHPLNNTLSLGRPASLDSVYLC